MQWNVKTCKELLYVRYFMFVWWWHLLLIIAYYWGYTFSQFEFELPFFKKLNVYILSKKYLAFFLFYIIPEHV